MPMLANLDLQTPWYLGGWLIVLVLILLMGAGLNLVGLAGNWVMLAVAGIHTFLVDSALAVGYSIRLLAVLVILALMGEGLEFISGVLGAGKVGGSRRAMILSVLGGMIGSVIGLGIGNTLLPIFGALVGILLGGGAGAFAGALAGEGWKGSGRQQSLNVGRAAFWGRIVGTLAKTLVGTLMLLLCLGALFF